MMRTRSCDRRQSVFSALVLGGFFVMASSAFAGPTGEPDIPSVNTTPQPRSVDEEVRLATDYFMGRGVAQDFKLAARWYEKAAEAGDPEAQMQIGYFYDVGLGVARDPARAVHWYHLAISGGLVGAKVNLAVAYLRGDGVPQNGQMAVQLFSEAAAKGDGLAASFLGEMYDRGIGVAQDKAAGERWYLKGAKLHDPQAEYNLGVLFSQAKDHTHDLRTAETLLRESASAGYVPAMHSLGLLLTKNPELAKSPDEAIGYLKDAANAGSWRSSVILGIVARDGDGVPVDTSAAYYHFRVATLQGGDEAKKLIEYDLRLLSSKLSQSQTQAIDLQAEQWYKEHPLVLEFIHKEGQNRTRFPHYALAVPEDGVHVVPLVPALPN
jgi:uncharacterized protein